MTINGYTLIPNVANYATAPKWKRSWETGISESVFGNETRSAFRAQPRVSLTWLVTPWTIQQQQQLEDALRAAAKSGYACAPYWGRGSVLSADVTGTAVSFSTVATTWHANDYVFLLDATNVQSPVWNVRQFSAVTPNYVLSAAVSQTFKAKTMAWPILFGKFSSQDMSAQTGRRGSVQITITELTSPASAVLGTAGTPGTGIGSMSIGGTFVVS